MGWINGKKAAQAAIAREAMADPGRRARPERLRAIRDDALSCKGQGTGGWSDEDIEEYADEINRHLG